MSNPRDAELAITGSNKLGPATSAAAKDLDKVRAKADAVGKSGSSMSDKFLGAAKRMQTGAFVAAAAVIKLGADAVKNASDSQQSLGATQQIFGKYSTAVVLTSTTAAKAFGLSANSYRESANLIGSLFKNQGVATDQLAAKTKKVIGLGADLSAVYGGTAKDAVEALSSAYKGEFDPLEKYGISLKQSTVNAAAFGVAGVKSQAQFSKLTVAQQRAATQQAVTNLLMKQGKDALGQFAAQSGTTAEQAQILKARYTDLSAQMGAKLLPIINKVLSAGVALLAWSTQHQTATLAVAVAVGVLAAGILALNLAMLANPVGLVIVGMALLAAAFVAAWKKSETFRAVMITVFQGVADAVLGAISAILGVFGKVFEVLGHLPGKAGSTFRAMAHAAETAKAKVDAVHDSINNLKSKTVHIRVNTEYKVYGTKGGHYNGSTFVPNSANDWTFGIAQPGGSYRTGGPQEITVTAGPNNINTAVYLDGNRIASIARTEVNNVAGTQAWRARTGRR